MESCAGPPCHELPVEALFDSIDSVHALGKASQVCHSWRTAARERARAALRGEFLLSVEATTLCLVSELIGSGGTARVYQLAGLPELCIKVCVGGSSVRTCCADPFSHHMSPACRKAERERQIEGDSLEAMYRWESTFSGATDLCGRMSMAECELLMRREHAMMARIPRPLGDVLPRVLGCSVGKQTAEWPSG